MIYLIESRHVIFMVLFVFFKNQMFALISSSKAFFPDSKIQVHLS